MFNWFKKLLTSKDIPSESTKSMIVDYSSLTMNNNTVPDGYGLMSGFGYKMNWYMIPIYELDKQDWTIENLADALNLQSQQKLSWDEGVEFGYQDPSEFDENIYISAPYEGWVYIIKCADEKLDLLDNLVSNYYAFGSYRVCDYVGWKKVVNNKVVRYFESSCGDLWKNIGSQTSEEKNLGFVDLSGLDDNEANELIFSDSVLNNDQIISLFDEDHVIDICEAWTGINPCDFDSEPIPIDCLPSVGIGGLLKKPA